MLRRSFLMAPAALAVPGFVSGKQQSKQCPVDTAAVVNTARCFIQPGGKLVDEERIWAAADGADDPDIPRGGSPVRVITHHAHLHLRGGDLHDSLVAIATTQVQTLLREKYLDTAFGPPRFVLLQHGDGMISCFAYVLAWDMWRRKDVSKFAPNRESWEAFCRSCEEINNG